MKAIHCAIVTLVVALLAGCATKYAHVPRSQPPQLFDDYAIQQYSMGFPPLLRPLGKRESIRVASQKFTVVIPDCIDVSGRSDDLRRSLADMLYTALYDTGRFNLFDRGELADIDPNRLIEAIKRESKDPAGESAGSQSGQATESIAARQTVRERILEGIAQNADGLLLTYITSREGTEQGGSFQIDYRIVSTEIKAQAVLLAKTQSVRYSTSTTRELAYDREDIKKIASEITRTFPRQEDIPERSRVISLDAGFVTIDIGNQKILKPGLRGFVFTEEDLADLPGVKQRIFLAQFQITEVYDEYSRAQILRAFSREGNLFVPTDIRVGDRVMIQ